MHGERLRCMRCGYEWASRKEGRPVLCPNPKCQSAKWDAESPHDADRPAKVSLAEWLEEARKFQAKLREKYGVFSAEAITDDIWAAREERAEQIWPSSSSTRT